MIHEFKGKVFFHEVDKGGVVYFANYLKILDNARTTMFNELGYGFSEQEKTGKIFAVANVNIKYRKSLRMDEEYVIKTELKEIRAASLEVHQTILRGTEIVTTSEMKLACLDFNNSGRPCEMPEGFGAQFKTIL
jgi:acyl-CoA thioester hydrolase